MIHFIVLVGKGLDCLRHKERNCVFLYFLQLCRSRLQANAPLLRSPPRLAAPAGRSAWWRWGRGWPFPWQLRQPSAWWWGQWGKAGKQDFSVNTGKARCFTALSHQLMLFFRTGSESCWRSSFGRSRRAGESWARKTTGCSNTPDDQFVPTDCETLQVLIDVHKAAWGYSGALSCIKTWTISVIWEENGHKSVWNQIQVCWFFFFNA